MRNLVIVGGGLAGVLTAKKLLNENKEWKVTIVEDPKYRGKGGINGESLTPSFVAFIQEVLGYGDTSKWLARSNAAIRVGGRFKGWGLEDIFIPQDMYRDSALPLKTWMKHSKPSKSQRKDLLGINALCFPAVGLMERGECPAFDVNSRQVREKHDWSVNLDASLLAEYILEDLHDSHRTTRFVYINKPVESVEVSEEGRILSIEVPGESIIGELYVDATGLSRSLRKSTGTDLEDCSDRFPNNRAVYGKVPGSSELNHVLSTTAGSGWLWEIPLQCETSVGYVYSSKFLSDEAALKELKLSYPGLEDSKLAKFTPSRLISPWKGNVVAIGAAQGIVDPLEANVLLQTKTHIQTLVDELKAPVLGSIQEAKFNRVCYDHWNAVISFVELHYRGCIRRDTKYWRYVTQIPQVPKGMEDFLVYYTSKIDEREFDWEKWFIIAAGLQLIDVDKLKG